MRWNPTSVVLGVIGLALASHACASEPIPRHGPPDAPGAPATCEPVPTCEAACAHVYQPRACTTADGRSPCIAYCKNEYDAWMPNECLDLWHEFLACRSCVEVSCDEADCAGPVCEGDPPYFLGCNDMDDAVLACAGPCLRGGTESGGSSEMSYRVEGAHCECPSDVAPGAPAGETCATDADCAEECCRCPDNDGAYRARACDHGTCLGGSALCEMEAGAVFVDTFCHGDGSQ